jgi:gamma-glutamylcyclotransferase (GGCT)/AIG2-like uncharacterized protein YtfP
VTLNLFVYGTLKRGGRNHARLVGQKFLGEFWTLPRYRLYDAGSYPCLVEDLLHGVAVQGEVWSVDPAILPTLDELEGAPTLFDRRSVLLAGFRAAVFSYLYQGDISSLPDGGTAWPRP